MSTQDQSVWQPKFALRMTLVIDVSDILIVLTALIMDCRYVRLHIILHESCARHKAMP